MKKIFSIFYFLISQFAFSQTDSLHSNKDSLQKKNHFPFEIFYGKKLYQNNFYNQLNTLDHFNFNSPLTFIGLGLNTDFEVSGRAYLYSGNLALLFIVPENICMDSLGNGKITGYEFSISCVGKDIIKNSKTLKLFVSGGINTGKIRIINNDLVRQRNLFLAPMVSICPKLILNHFSVAINIQYDYDITSSNWKRVWFAEHKKVDLGKFRQSGLTSFICIGYEP